MSKNINVNPDHYKVAGRERPGEDIVQEEHKARFSEVQGEVKGEFARRAQQRSEALDAMRKGSKGAGQAELFSANEAGATRGGTSKKKSAGGKKKASTASTKGGRSSSSGTRAAGKRRAAGKKSAASQEAAAPKRSVVPKRKKRASKKSAKKSIAGRGGVTAKRPGSAKARTAGARSTRPAPKK